VQIAPCDAEHLALANDLCRFDSLNHRPRSCYCPGPLHRMESALDVAVIGFDSVIAVRIGSMAAVVRDATFSLQFADRRRITPQTIAGELTWRAVVGVRQMPFEGTIWRPRGRASSRGRSLLSGRAHQRHGTGTSTSCDPNKSLIQCHVEDFRLSCPWSRR
jgi:hypothetical protein